MPPALAMCLCLIGVLFFGALVGLSYAHLKLPNPEKDGYFKAQSDLADRFGFEYWAEVQRSKAARWASLVLSSVLFIASAAGAIWFGALAISSA